MISVIYTLNGQIGAASYEHNSAGKNAARLKFNSLVEKLQTLDGQVAEINADTLCMFINPFGAVQLTSSTPIRPLIKIYRKSFKSRRCKCKK